MARPKCIVVVDTTYSSVRVFFLDFLMFLSCHPRGVFKQCQRPTVSLGQSRYAHHQEKLSYSTDDWENDDGGSDDGYDDSDNDGDDNGDNYDNDDDALAAGDFVL